MSRYRLAVSSLMVCREPGPTNRTKILSPEVAASMFREYLAATFGNDDRERFVLIALDAKNHVLSFHTVSVGAQSQSVVDPKHVLRVALLSGAASIIIGHNHPSGDPEPSREDIKLTRQLKDACLLLDIKLHDHLVIGDGTTNFVSLATRGAM